MIRPSAPWLAVALAVPLVLAGCAHRADRSTGDPAPPVAAAHAHRAAGDGRPDHGGRHHRHHGTPDCPGQHEGAGHPGSDGRHGGHEGHEGHRARAPQAARWPAEAPLRRGMSRVRAVADSLVHASHGHLDPAQVPALGAELKSAVQTMFVECRLEPAPDAALHPLLARLLAAGQALADGGSADAALTEVRAVLARYAELFSEDETIVDQIDSA
jgi:hypothetical protein